MKLAAIVCACLWSSPAFAQSPVAGNFTETHASRSAYYYTVGRKAVSAPKLIHLAIGAQYLPPGQKNPIHILAKFPVCPQQRDGHSHGTYFVAQVAYELMVPVDAKILLACYSDDIRVPIVYGVREILYSTASMPISAIDAIEADPWPSTEEVDK
jgi:hypothetical protein